MRTRTTACLVVGLLLSVLFTAPAHAAGGTTYTWVGDTKTPSADNHSWSDQRNWDPQGVPGDGDSVVIEQPAPTCFAHVDGVPTVSLVNFTVAENPSLCSVSVTGGAITVAGLFQWNGGELATPTTVAGTGAALVNGSNQRLNTLAATLDVFGTLSLTGVDGSGMVRIVAPQVLHIEPGATLVSSGPNAIDGGTCCVDPARILNEGDVSVDGGTLTLSTLGFDQHGSIDATLDGRVDTVGAVVSTDTGTSYSGNGGWLIEQGTAAHFGGTVSIGRGFRLDFGGLAATSSSALAGTATVTGKGTFAWTGGVIEAAVTIAHGATMEVRGAHDGGARRVLDGIDPSGGAPGVPVTFTNHGTIAIGDHASVSTSASARLVNASDGVLALEPGTSIAAQGCCVSPDRLTNAGTLSVVPTSGRTVILDGISYRSSANTVIAAGKTLTVSGGAASSLISGRVGGGGRLLVLTPTAASGTVIVAAHTTLQVGPRGSLDGSATVSGAGAFSWTGGALSGAPVFSPGGGISVSGSPTKTVADIGGGSMPSVVRFAAPTAIAAGRANAHDLVGLGASRLILAAPTSAGRFTEFADGTLDNRAALSIHTGTVFARTITQPASGALLLDVAASAHGTVHALGAVSLRGTLRVHDAIRPAGGAALTVLSAQSISAVPSCVATSGTGSGSGHWAATHSATALVLRWRPGAPPHC